VCGGSLFVRNGAAGSRYGKSLSPLCGECIARTRAAYSAARMGGGWACSQKEEYAHCAQAWITQKIEADERVQLEYGELVWCYKKKIALRCGDEGQLTGLQEEYIVELIVPSFVAEMLHLKAQL
jgi:hypothetical protein